LRLSIEVGRIPEECSVEVFAPNGPDQSLDEGMRHRGVRDGLDFLDLEESEVREPSVDAEQGIVIGADSPGRCLAGDGLIEQAAAPSMNSPPMPKPMNRRVYTSITTRTQWLQSRIDSPRNRSTLQRLSLVCAQGKSARRDQRIPGIGREGASPGPATRLGRTNRAIRPNTKRSTVVRGGSRRRERPLTISWCFSNRDSAMTERTPPGRAPWEPMLPPIWYLFTEHPRRQRSPPFAARS